MWDTKAKTKLFFKIVVELNDKLMNFYLDYTACKRSIIFYLDV